ncbi:hypothetical protein F3F96_05350 [Mariprofundus sp. NF]|uniref:hypothetical protein n=1 Tax=Mariprofundus sp. NF TaxID=2608716 RepID=UPI0015A2F5FC|nr:hypothetical protein [Mariprofundus sp. NF]NWF38552.1 hypothetical protein [Mariprofundus sp. NF]
MITITELKENGALRYQAEVRSSKHSLQSAIFTSRDDAEKWASWLKLRIGTDEVIKGIKSS